MVTARWVSRMPARRRRLVATTLFLGIAFLLALAANWLAWIVGR